MHLTNASGQTVSLLNDAGNARSGQQATKQQQQWTATVVAKTPSISASTTNSRQQLTTYPYQSSQSSQPSQQRPTLPSLPSLEQLSAAAALNGREQEQERQDQLREKSASTSSSTISARPALAHYHSSGNSSYSSNSSGSRSPLPSPAVPSQLHRHHNHHHHPHSHPPTSSSSSTAISTSSSSHFSTTTKNNTTTTTTTTNNSSSSSAPFSANDHSQSVSSSAAVDSSPSRTTSSYRPPRPSLSTDLRYSYTLPHISASSSSTPGYSTSSSHSTSSLPTNLSSRPRLTHHEAYSSESSYTSQHSSNSSSSSPPPSSSSLQSEPADSPVFSPGAPSSSRGACPPQLLRYDSTSTSSTSTRSARTPSPMTPSFGFDPLDQNKNGNPNNIIDNPYARPIIPPGAVANAPFFNPATGLPLQPHITPQQMPISAMQGVAMISPSTATPVYAFSTGPSPLGFEDPAFGLVPPVGLPFPPVPGVTADLIQPSPVNNLNASVSPQNPHVTPVDPNANNNPSQQKAKKKYPCPHAARFGCTDTFTTSGHAARHGKKHTGEKNILCPTCNKAFTRKDNMKQHERTHRNNNSTSSVRNRRESLSAETSEGTPGAASKDGNSSKRTKTSANSMSSSIATDAAPTPSTIRTSSMPFSPLPGSVSSFPLDDTLLDGGPSPGVDELSYGSLLDMNAPKAQRPINERKISEGGQSMDGEGESPGLDALAMAAGMS